MTDASGARRKLRLFNLNVVRHLTADVTTTLEEIGRGDIGRRPLRRSHTLGGPLHGSAASPDTPSIMRLLPRLRPRQEVQVQTTMGSGRRDSYGDEIIDDDMSSGSSPLAAPLPAAYARYLKRASMPFTAPSGGNGTSLDPYRLRTLPRPEDRRSRVSRIYSDLNRKRTGEVSGSTSGMALQSVQGMPLMTPASAAAAGRTTIATTRHNSGGYQSRGQRRRHIGYDPRPQDVVEKCERWVASLPATFGDVMGRDIIPILDSEVTSESGDSDMDGLLYSGVS